MGVLQFLKLKLQIFKQEIIFLSINQNNDFGCTLIIGDQSLAKVMG